MSQDRIVYEIVEVGTAPDLNRGVLDVLVHRLPSSVYVSFDREDAEKYLNPHREMIVRSMTDDEINRVRVKAIVKITPLERCFIEDFAVQCKILPVPRS